MSDILDIQTQCSSELDDESDNFITSLKGKIRKGRGFIQTSGGEIANIKSFDKLSSNHEHNENGILPQSSVEGWVLFITGMHEEATEDDLSDLLLEYGVVKNLTLNLDRRTGYIKGYALVEFSNYEEAFNAKENLDESQLLGQAIKVNWAFIKSPTNMAKHKLPKRNYQNKHGFCTYRRN